MPEGGVVRPESEPSCFLQLVLETGRAAATGDAKDAQGSGHGQWAEHGRAKGPGPGPRCGCLPAEQNKASKG